MSAKHNGVYAKLMAPFLDEKSRMGQGGKSFTYITARQAMNRLDDVLGPDGWFDVYTVNKEVGMICALTLIMEDGTEITKQDGAGSADMDDESDEFKSMISGAFKRAAAKHGVGRYCYNDGVPTLAAALFEGHHAAKSATSNYSSEGGNGSSTGGQSGFTTNYNCPKSGRALFAWMKDRESEFGWSVLDAINGHKEIKNKFPQRMTEWNEPQVAFAYATMKQMWTEAGKWPSGQGSSPGEVANQPGASSAPVAADATPEQLKEVKGKIRQVYTTPIENANPGMPVTYVTLMMRVNASAKIRGFQIDNMVAYRDFDNLNSLLSDGEMILSGDDIPF